MSSESDTLAPGIGEARDVSIGDGAGPSKTLASEPIISQPVIDMSHTREFLGGLNQFDESLEFDNFELPVREALIQPAATIEFVLNRGTIPFCYKPELRYRRELTFPYRAQPIPIGYAFAMNQTFPGGNDPTAWLQQMFDIPLNQSLTSGEMNNLLSHLAYNVPDYACDPPTNLGHTCDLERVWLESVDGGRIIDDLNQTQGFESYNFLQLANRQGADFRAYDLKMKTNICQYAQDIEPSLLPTFGVNGTRRAVSFSFDGGLASPDPVKFLAGQSTITVVQEVSMPVPLYIGDKWPVNWMADSDLKLNVTLRAFNNGHNYVAATRDYTSMLDSYLHSKLYIATDINDSDVTQASGITPIASWQYLPTVPRNSDNVTDGFAPAGSQSTLRIVITAIPLDTNDLEAVLGASNLTVPSAYDNLPGLAFDAAGTVPYNFTGTNFPLSSMLNNGLLLHASLAALDHPSVDSGDMLMFQPGEGNDTFDQLGTDRALQAMECNIGNRVLRAMWSQQYIFASEIAGICLATPAQVFVPGNSSNTDAVEAIAAAVDTSSWNSGCQGKVYVVLNHPILLDIPLFGIDMSDFIVPTLDQIDATALGHGYTERGGILQIPYPSPTGFTSNVTSNYGSDIRNAEPVNVMTLGSVNKTMSEGGNFIPTTNRFKIALRVSTGRPSFPGFGASGVNGHAGVADNGYGMPQVYKAADVTSGNIDNVTAGVLPLTLYNTNFNRSQFVSFPTSVRYSNMRLGYMRPRLPESIVKDLDQIWGEASGPGLSITNVRMTKQSFPLQTMQTRQVSVQATVTNPYFIQFAIRCTNAQYIPFMEQAMPYTTFDQVSILQGSQQVYYQLPVYQQQNIGGEWPMKIPYFGQMDANHLPNPTVFLKGNGGTQYEYRLLAKAIGNAFGNTGDNGVSNSVNLAYTAYCHYPLDTFYCMNTAGGAAEIPRLTMFTVEFGVVNNFDSASLFGEENLTLAVTGQSGLPDPTTASDYGTANGLLGPAKTSIFGTPCTQIRMSDWSEVNSRSTANPRGMGLRLLDANQTFNQQLEVRFYHRVVYNFKKGYDERGNATAAVINIFT